MFRIEYLRVSSSTRFKDREITHVPFVSFSFLTFQKITSVMSITRCPIFFLLYRSAHVSWTGNNRANEMRRIFKFIGVSEIGKSSWETNNFLRAKRLTYFYVYCIATSLFWRSRTLRDLST